MSRKILFLLALAALLLTAALPAGATSPPTVMNLLDLTTRQGTVGGTPNGPPAPGTIYTFHDVVFKWNGAKRGAAVGHVDGSVQFVSASYAPLSVVASLPGGQLVIVGNGASGGRVQRLAITGGTGSYAGARGEVIVRTIGGENSPKSAITLRIWR
jgi:hypothetical protein